jgi:D-alanyl-D-alanine carboxypeptidase
MQDSGADTFEEYHQLLSDALKAAEASEAEIAVEPKEKKSEKDSEKELEKSGDGVVADEDLLVLRFLPPYRDWGFGFTE